MSIEKTPSGRWRVRVDIGRDSFGKRKRKTKVVPTKREAQALEHMWSEMARTDAVVRDSWRFDDFVHEMYLPAVEKRVRYTTIEAYRRDIKLRLLPAFGHRALGDITKSMVQAMIDGCATYKVAKNARDTLRQIMSFAVENGYIKSNCALSKFKFPERTLYPEDHNGIWLTTFAEHDDFIAKVDHPSYRLMCALGLGLGLRRGEIFGLDWEDVDLDRRIVHVQRTYARQAGGHKLMSPKTVKSDRMIPIRKKIADYLVEFRSTLADPTGAICRGAQGDRAIPTSVSKGWMKYIRKKSLPEVTILNMRHSFATACMMGGMDVTKVSVLLGHTNITTTVNRYVRYRPDDMVKDFDDLFD